VGLPPASQCINKFIYIISVTNSPVYMAILTYGDETFYHNSSGAVYLDDCTGAMVYCNGAQWFLLNSNINPLSGVFSDDIVAVSGVRLSNARSYGSNIITVTNVLSTSCTVFYNTPEQSIILPGHSVAKFYSDRVTLTYLGKVTYS
jgi:hypothetical protein